MLTNNGKRKPEQVDAANPRADNRFGHIIEMIPPGGDHAAAQVPLGDPGEVRRPAVAEVGATFSTDTTSNGWFGMPDNLRRRQPGPAVGRDRRQQPKSAPAAPTACGASRPKARGRGTSRLFFRVPVGAEMCGPCFTPDDETLFVAVQHPGRRRSRRRRALDLRGAVDALARLQARHAAAAVGGRHHQARRRQDRVGGMMTRCGRYADVTNATPRKRPFRQITRQLRSAPSFKTSENKSGKSSTLRAAVRRAPPSEISQTTQRTSGQ